MTETLGGITPPSIPNDPTDFPQGVSAGAEGNAEPPVGPGPDMSKEERQAALTEDYTVATKWLREKYMAEFNTRRQELAKERGIDWKPKLNKTDAAKKKALDALAAAGLTAADLG